MDTLYEIIKEIRKPDLTVHCLNQPVTIIEHTDYLGNGRKSYLLKTGAIITSQVYETEDENTYTLNENSLGIYPWRGSNVGYIYTIFQIRPFNLENYKSKLLNNYA